MCIYIIYIIILWLYITYTITENQWTNIYIYNTIYDYISPYGRTLLAKMWFDQCNCTEMAILRGNNEAMVSYPMRIDGLSSKDLAEKQQEGFLHVPLQEVPTNSKSEPSPSRRATSQLFPIQQQSASQFPIINIHNIHNIASQQFQQLFPLSIISKSVPNYSQWYSERTESAHPERCLGFPGCWSSKVSSRTCKSSWRSVSNLSKQEYQARKMMDQYGLMIIDGIIYNNSNI